MRVSNPGPLGPKLNALPLRLRKIPRNILLTIDIQLRDLWDEKSTPDFVDSQRISQKLDSD